MKKFSDSENEKLNNFSAEQKMENDIINLLDKTLYANVNEKNIDNAKLIGKENAAKELSNIIKYSINETKINYLEKCKSDPSIILEKIETKNELLDLVVEAKDSDYKDVMKIIKDAKKHGDSEVEIMSYHLSSQAIVMKLQNNGYKIKANGENYLISW